MLVWMVMKTFFHLCVTLIAEYLDPFSGEELNYKKTEEVWFHFLLASAEHCGVNSLILFALNDIENVLFNTPE